MIGDRLRYYRAMKNLTQRDLASSANISIGHMGQIESRNSEITLGVAIKLRKALELKDVEIFTKPLLDSEKLAMKNIINKRVDIKIENRRKKQAEYKKRHIERKKLV